MDWDEKRKIEKIHAFLFDLGGVLGLDVPKYFVRELALKLEKEDDDIVKSFLSHWESFIKGEITEEKFYEEILLDLGIGTDLKGMIKKCKEIVRSCLSLDNNVVNLLKELQEAKKKDYPKEKFFFCIFSNTAKEWVAYLDKMHPGFFTVFDKSYLSYDLKMRKPDKEMFEFVLKDLDLKPEQLLFIEDSKQNVTTAEKVGAKALHIKNAAELKQKFQEMELIGGE